MPNVDGMGRVPESTVEHLLHWIACERDAAWAAKLAVLRTRDFQEIAHFGACVREHERHADELAQLVRAIDRYREIPAEPAFVTRDAFVVGDLAEGDGVLQAVAGLERARIARYELRARRYSVLDALLERHLQDARTRLSALDKLRVVHRPHREAAA
jgi:hypothetical protein